MQHCQCSYLYKRMDGMTYGRTTETVKTRKTRHNNEKFATDKTDQRQFVPTQVFTWCLTAFIDL